MTFVDRAVLAAPSLPSLEGVRAHSAGLAASNAQRGGRAGGRHLAGEAWF